MSFTFLRPIGAVADYNELEYVAALHQSGKEVTALNDTVNAEDISVLLMSRHGISVTPEYVQTRVLSDVGVKKNDDDDEEEEEEEEDYDVSVKKESGGARVLDAPRILSLLTIPLLLSVVAPKQTKRGTSDDDDDQDEETPLGRKDFVLKWEYERYVRNFKGSVGMEPPTTIIEDMLKVILNRTFGHDPDRPPPILTKDLLRAVFHAYELDFLVREDELMNEMIATAAAAETGRETGTEEVVLLNGETFARALTRDVELYDIRNDYSLSTIYEDVFKPMTVRKGNYALEESGGLDQEEESKDVKTTMAKDDEAPQQKNDEHSPTTVFALSQIDMLAERVTSQTNIVLSLLAFFLSYLTYFYLVNDSFDVTSVGVCAGKSDFGCKVTQSIVSWLIIMVSHICLGVPYLTILNLGNEESPKALELFVGTAGVIVFLIVPGFVSYEIRGVLKITAAIDAGFGFPGILNWSLFVSGCVMLAIKLFSLCQLFLSKKKANSPFLSTIFTAPNARRELKIKQAATFKVNQLVNNAFELHVGESHNEHLKSTNFKMRKSEPLKNYSALSRVTEQVGGVIWAWKSHFNDELMSREGIWLHARIKAGVIFQFIFAVAVITLSKTLFQTLRDSYYPLDKTTACGAKINLATCNLYPPYDNFYECLVNIESSECYAQSSGSYCENKLGDQCDYLVQMLDGNNGTVYGVADRALAENGNCALSVDYCNLGGVEFNGTDIIWLNETVEITCLVGMQGKSGRGCSSAKAGLTALEYVPDSTMFDGSQHLNLGYLKLCVLISSILGGAWSFFLGISYVSSSVSTILRFRSGVLPSLRGGCDFNVNRISTTKVSMVLGAIFWGDFFSSILLILLIFAILIIPALEPARPYVETIAATIMGVTVSIVLKEIVVMIFGRRNTKGFYTNKPLVTNVFEAALECWSITLTAGYMLARTLKILIAAILFAARIDTPFLADGADKLGPIVLDPYCDFYRQNLLASEAHHHPYIERLGSMYMMKIRYGNAFCTMPGSTWRLLFIFALMPWVQKGHLDKPKGDDVDSDVEFEKNRLNLIKEEKKQDMSILHDKVAELMKENEELKEMIRLQNKTK